MPGFLGVIAIKNHIPKNFELEINSMVDELGEALIRKTVKSEDFIFIHLTLPKFSSDKFLIYNEKSVQGVEGVIFNKKDIMNKYSLKDWESVFRKVSFENAISEFRGEFSAFVYDREREELMLATDQISSKPVFYTLTRKFFVFGNEFRYVIYVLKILGEKLKFSEIGFHSMLEFGYMLEDITLLEGVYKLKAGYILKYSKNDNRLEKLSYFNPLTEPLIRNENEAVKMLDEAFTFSVKQEWGKDLEYGYKHLATLSGGLDSRTNVLIAKELGFKDITTITFSESDYLDEKIAKRIARENGFTFLFRSLDNGNYLFNIDKYVKANGGLVVFVGSAHGFSTLELLNTKRFGVLHTGQLGDAVLGTYLGKSLNPRTKDLKDFIESAKKFYESDEKFILYNRGYNGILNGNWNSQHFTEVGSPFLSPEFLEVALKISPDLKKHEWIYLRWLRKMHKESYKYPWESYRGMKPSTPKGIVFIKKVYHGAFKRVFGQPRWHSMNPFNYWFRKNHELNKYLLFELERSKQILFGMGFRSDVILNESQDINIIFRIITLGKFVEIFMLGDDKS